jgi:hypothetical protein
LKSRIHSLNYVKKINIPEHIIGLTDELKPQGKVWSERTNSQTNAQMVVSSFIQRTDVTIDRSSGYLFCHGAK